MIKKILVSTYATAFINSGGGEFELVQFIDLLNDLGYEVDLYGRDNKKLDYYDYYIHYSIHGHGIDYFNTLAEKNKKIFLWPNIFKDDKINYDTLNFFISRSYKLLFKSQVEKDDFINLTHVDDEKCVVVPININPKFLIRSNTELHKTITSFSNYALCIARFEKNKNQLNILRALKDLNLQSIFVGYPSDIIYFNKCAKLFDVNTLVLESIPSQSALLKSLYAGCAVYIETSLDYAGRTALEAASFIKPIVLSKNKWSDEYFSDFYYAANPKNIRSIKNAINSAINDDNLLKKSKLSFAQIKSRFLLNSPESTFEEIISTIFH
jgi:glycosyltransferase involved in cell wall biosynthesis